jgi:hypothetical protein
VLAARRPLAGVRVGLYDGSVVADERLNSDSFTSLTNRASHQVHCVLEPVFILLLTLAGFAAMGYHPGLEDDGIYLSAVKADLNPSLYPRDGAFFRLQSQATLFDEFISGFVRITRIPVAWAELLWQFLSLYTILWASNCIAQRLFPERHAQWAGVSLLGAMFTLPVAGTALDLADQHLHPRTAATALILVAIERTLSRRFWQAALLLVLAMLFHPIMAALGISFCVFLAIVLTNSMLVRFTKYARSRAKMAVLPLGWVFEAPTPEWRRALGTRTYYFLYQWTWYEWLGAIGPLVLFWILWIWAGRDEKHPSGPKARLMIEAASAPLTSCPVTKPDSSRVLPQTATSCPVTKAEPETGQQPSELRADPTMVGKATLGRFSFAVLLYGCFQQALAMILLAPGQLIRVTPLQPMRYLHLVYLFLVLIGGGLLGRHVLHRSPWRWAFFLMAAYGGMFVLQRLLFPASVHLELPGRVPANPWLEAFAWIRQNTPGDAYFALDPNYLAAPGEDYHSFRALAERSQLADAIKDAAVVTQVPELAPRWTDEVDAQAGWSRFQAPDFERLKEHYGVDWVLVSYPAPARLICEWHNDRLAVCRI